METRSCGNFRFLPGASEVALVLLLGSLGCGCATTRGCLSAVPGTGQRLEYRDGCPILVSTGTNLVAISVLKPVLRGTRYASFHVWVVNGTAESFLFAPDSIAVDMGTNKLHVATYFELEDRIERDARVRRVGASIGAASQSFGAAQRSHTQSTGLMTTRGSLSTGGTFPASARNTAQTTTSSVSSTYDPASVARANAAIDARRDAMMGQISSDRYRALASLTGYLRKNTVHPGEAVGGEILIRLPRPPAQKEVLLLTVKTPGDLHEFQFTYERVAAPEPPASRRKPSYVPEFGVYSDAFD